MYSLRIIEKKQITNFLTFVIYVARTEFDE
jgi:hypothetical protein